MTDLNIRTKVNYPPNRRVATVMEINAASIDKLSVGQQECLLLVRQHFSSKEIATQLGFSSHTIDQRIRGAMAILGSENRWQAARQFTDYLEQTEQFGIAKERQDGIDTSPAEPPQSRFRKPRLKLELPFATLAHPTNEMSVASRLLWILAIGFGMFFAGIVYLAGLESLSRMLTSGTKF